MKASINTLTRLISALLFISVSATVYAQDSLLQKLAAENHTRLHFSENENSFNGPGWNQIVEQVRGAQNVLIGEDHFTNEIPAFTQTVADLEHIDNFIIELDPYSTEIIERSLRKHPATEREKFNQKYRSFFSFYALDPEYRLLENMVSEGTNLMGAEQIVKYADQLVLQELAATTSNKKARQIYQQMMDSTGRHFKRFQNNRASPLYFTEPEFGDKLHQLEKLHLSEREQQVLRDMKISREIYDENNHAKRIGLIKRILFDSLETWRESNNLFKYGAVHMPRGESLLQVYDVGNLVANVSDAQFSDSYHIMIFGKRGMKGAPFVHYPNTRVDASKGMLSNMAPFFEAMKDDSDGWYVLDIRPLRKALNEKQLKVDNRFLKRIIKGYDTVVIIPEVTAAEF